MKSYEAIRINSSIDNRRESGLLQICSDRVEFQSESELFIIPMDLLSISAGGAGDRLVFFTDKNNSSISVYTSDRTVLKNEILLANRALSLEIKSSKRVIHRIIYSTLGVCLFFGLLIFGAYLAKDYFVEKLANQVPRIWEKKAGDQLFSALSSEYDFIKNDSLEKVFLEVAKPLIQQVEKKGIKIDLYFVSNPSINAFALPGGKVVIQSGLIENAKSWEEVLGVLGHELAHVTRRHHIRGIINELGLYTILAATIGDVSALAGTFASMGGELASLSNSRAFETEADDTGWEYLLAARVNPKGMISFFETLEKEENSKIEGYMSFISTHPATKERIENLKAHLKENIAHFKMIQNDFSDFKKAIKKSNNK